jgi:hypothetical protein
MRLPGCVNEPLALPDGSVLAACNNAIVQVADGGLEAVAGGFGGNVHLLAGADGEPWVAAICEALRPAHEAGWIHRDLKPSNPLQLAGTWTVADWGLTRRPRGQTTNPDRTRAGEAGPEARTARGLHRATLAVRRTRPARRYSRRTRDHPFVLY